MGAILTPGVVFLHVPKTGGSWVFHVLKKKKLVKKKFKEKHANYSRYKALEPKHFAKKLPVFCFIRHPVYWYESWFKYQSQPRFDWKDWGYKPFHPCTPLDGCGNNDFNVFIENVLEKCPGFVTKMYHGFTKKSTFVGRQEDLVSDLIRAMKVTCGYKLSRIGIYQKVNVSTPIEIRWNKGLLQAVLDSEKEIINIWYAKK